MRNQLIESIIKLDTVFDVKCLPIYKNFRSMFNKIMDEVKSNEDTLKTLRNIVDIIMGTEKCEFIRKEVPSGRIDV